MNKNTPYKLPNEGFVRIAVLANNPKKGTQGIIPISRSTFLNRVKAGIYPKPVNLGSSRSVAWRVSDIRKLISELGGTA